MAKPKLDADILLEQMRVFAPGCYTERDGGDWYAVAPNHDRLAEGFTNRDTARAAIIWLATGNMPDGWSVLSKNDLFAELKCEQDYDATVWVRAVAKQFPTTRL